MAVTRVVIVEDEALFRELLRRSLSAEAGQEIVGVAEDGETAIHLARELTPDVYQFLQAKAFEPGLITLSDL